MKIKKKTVALKFFNSLISSRQIQSIIIIISISMDKQFLYLPGDVGCFLCCMKNSGIAETYQRLFHLLFLRTPLPEMTGYKYTYFGTCSDKEIFKKQEQLLICALVKKHIIWKR